MTPAPDPDERVSKCEPRCVCGHVEAHHMSVEHRPCRLCSCDGWAMTTDDERPSGTGLRGAVEDVLAAAEQRQHPMDPRNTVVYVEDVRKVLAAHPDAAAGTGPEKCGGCGSSWNLVAMGRPGPDQWWLHPDCGWRSKEASDDD